MVKRRLPSMPDQLERASHKLDRVIRDARLDPGRNHAARYDDIATRVEAIADELRAAVRGPMAPSAAPLAIATRGNRTRALF